MYLFDERFIIWHFPRRMRPRYYNESAATIPYWNIKNETTITSSHFTIQAFAALLMMMYFSPTDFGCSRKCLYQTLFVSSNITKPDAFEGQGTLSWTDSSQMLHTCSLCCLYIYLKLAVCRKKRQKKDSHSCAASRAVVSQRGMGSIWPRSFHVEFACSLRVLQFPPTVRRHAGSLNCPYVHGCLFVFLCWAGIGSSTSATSNAG